MRCGLPPTSLSASVPRLECRIVAAGSRSLKCAVFPIFDFKKCGDLEIGVRGYTLKVVLFYRLGVVSY